MHAAAKKLTIFFILFHGIVFQHVKVANSCHKSNKSHTCANDTLRQGWSELKIKKSGIAAGHIISAEIRIPYSIGTFITTFFTGAGTPPGARPGSWASSGKTTRK